MASTFAWLALFTGVAGTWYSGKNKMGWIITMWAGFFWLCFGAVIHQPAEIIASLISMGLSIRNYVVWDHGHNISDSNNS